jgi:hypothetical protein
MKIRKIPISLFCATLWYLLMLGLLFMAQSLLEIIILLFFWAICLPLVLEIPGRSYLEIRRKLK